MATASMNGIKARIKSVQNTMQITKAMELVATSKLRHAKEKADASRALLATLNAAIGSVAGTSDARESRFLKPDEGGKTLYLVIAGDRGLAGGYNANIFRLVKSVQKENAVFLPIGKKALEHYRHIGAPLYGEEIDSVADFGVGRMISVASRIAADYQSGTFSRVVLVYTEFASMLSQIPRITTLLPLPRPDSAIPSDTLFEGDPEEILAAIIPSYLAGEISCAVAEALASESGARRTAMNAANKNAGEMIDGLMLYYNRARQAVITQEITEIVSGAEAL